MSSLIEIRFLRLQSDSGDVTYQVQSRLGETGECPPVFTMFDGHFAEDALKELRRAARAAIDGKLDRLRRG